jgi:phosphate:Na+ symporter
MVIGANVGTTSTALFAVIGATSNARRVASAHIIFNLATGIVALVILPVLFWIVSRLESLLGLEANLAFTLAMFHTVFNLLGVLLIYPFNNRFADFLEKRFVTREESAAQPRYLDQTVAVTPALAVNALMLEMSRVTELVHAMSLAAFSVEQVRGKRIEADYQVVSKLSSTITDFVAMLERGVLGSEVSQQLGKILQIQQYLLLGAEQALEIVAQQAALGEVDDSELQASISRFRADAVKLVQTANPADAAYDFGDCTRQYDQLQLAYEEIKAALMLAGSELRVPIPLIIDIIDQNARIRRLCRQLMGAMHLLDELARSSDIGPAPDEPARVSGEGVSPG